MISKDGKLLETIVNVDNTEYNIKDNNLLKTLEPIYKKMAIEKKLLSLIKKNQIENNPQTCVLCNIIENYLPLNYFQQIVMKETLHYAITVEKNQYNNKSQQFLFYIRDDGRVGKS